jgi:hypothetical protein
VPRSPIGRCSRSIGVLHRREQCAAALNEQRNQMFYTQNTLLINSDDATAAGASSGAVLQQQNLGQAEAAADPQSRQPHWQDEQQIDTDTSAMFMFGSRCSCKMSSELDACARTAQAQQQGQCNRQHRSYSAARSLIAAAAHCQTGLLCLTFITAL